MSDNRKRECGNQPNAGKPIELPPVPPSGDGNGQFRPPQNFAIRRGAPPFPADLQIALDRAKQSENYYIIVCIAEDTTADCNIDIHSTRSAGFHRGNLVRAWQKAGAQILDFTQEVFLSAVQRFAPQLAELVSRELAKDSGGPSSADATDKPD